jgi:HK97 gp10 family phage protein
MARLVSKLSYIVAATDSAAQKAVENTANRVGDEAQARAPVRTGQLRDSKKVEIAFLVALVGFTAPHSNFVNFGTSRMAANPFFSAVWFLAAGMFREELKKQLGELM